MVRTIELLSAVLALIAAAGAILLVVAALMGDRVPVVAGWARAVHRHRTALTLAVAGLSTLGSLFFSEYADYVPCRLCWFQRILMYPIALIALIALVRRDRSAHWYILPFAVIGASVSLYHYLIEWGVLADSGQCSLFGPACSTVWFRTFGFVSLAFMALSGFVAIIALNLVPSIGTASPQEDS